MWFGNVISTIPRGFVNGAVGKGAVTDPIALIAGIGRQDCGGKKTLLS